MKNIFHEIAKSNFIGYFLRYSLWLTDNYLLYIQVVFVTERYKRYYPKDIKAIQFKKNSNFLIGNIVWGGLLFLSGLIISNNFQSRGLLFWLILFFLILAKLIYHLSLGRTCDFYIITEISSEKIKAITHLKKAEKFVKMINPLILDSQKDLKKDTNEEPTHPNTENIDIISSESKQIESDSSVNTLPKEQINYFENSLQIKEIVQPEGSQLSSIIPDLPNSNLKLKPGYWHFGLFIMIIINGLFLFLPEITSSPFITVLIFLLSLGTITIASIILFKQSKKIISNSGRKLIIFYVVTSLFLLMLYYIWLSYYAMRHMNVNYNFSVDSGIKYILETGIKNISFIRYTNLLFGSILCFFGISGFLLVNKEN